MSLMAQETLQAASAVARQAVENAATCRRLADRFAKRPPHLVATVARGSSDHAAAYAKYLIETRLGLPVMSHAPSIGSLYKRPMALKDSLFLIISQSGKSPDLVENVKWAKANGAFTLALVNDESSPVAALTDETLPLCAGEERSVAATKSYIASLSGLFMLTAFMSGDMALKSAHTHLPDQLEEAAALPWDDALEIFTQAKSLLTIGRGLSFGIALEAALKFKETSAIHAEGFSGAELLHGPLAIIRKDFPLLVFSQQDETRKGMTQLVDSLRDKGAEVFVAEEGPRIPGRLPVVQGLHPAVAPISMIQSFYILAEKVARARGNDPDRPPMLNKVTETL